jgi:hypothetical protein
MRPRSAKHPVYAKADQRCFWCHEQAHDSSYRSPIKDIPGARFVVCGPTCEAKPDGAIVFTDRRAL